MENENLEQVQELIDDIADSYDLPEDEQVSEMQRLTGQDWTSEELQESCCEYWSHHSLEETAYLMFHGKYPPVQETKLVFWKYKNGVVLDDETVYSTYRFGKKPLKALEPLPLKEILEKIHELFPQWQQEDLEDDYYRFDPPAQENYWVDTHFDLSEYGRELPEGREHQLLVFLTHNMNQEQIDLIMACMESFQCPLHIQENHDND